MHATVETVATKVGFASAFSGDSFIFHLYNKEISILSQKHIRHDFDLLLLKIP